MRATGTTPARWLRAALWLAAAAVSSAAFCVVRLEHCPEIYYASYRSILAGTADTPFQHRVLVPLIGRGLAALPGIDAATFDPTFAIDLVAVTLVLVVAGAYLRHLGRSPAWALALYYMMWVNYIGDFGYNMRQCYDMPALLFALLATIALREGRYVWFYAILPVALLNRESAAFFAVLFVLTQRDRLSRPALAGHVAAQLGLIAAVKGVLWWTYRDNPGLGALSFFLAMPHGWATSRLRANLAALAGLRILPVFGGLWVPILVLRKRLVDPFTRRALWLVPIVFAAMLLVGNLVELRIYTELVPIMFLAFVETAGRPAAERAALPA